MKTLFWRSAAFMVMYFSFNKNFSADSL